MVNKQWTKLTQRTFTINSFHISVPAPPPEDVISLDDTQVELPTQVPVPIVIDTDEIEYVGTVLNPNPVVIDLCETQDDLSQILLPPQSPSRRRRRNVNRERSRSPIRADHSYSVQPDVRPPLLLSPLPPAPMDLSPSRAQPPAPTRQPVDLVRPTVAHTRPPPVAPSQTQHDSLNSSIASYGTCSICLDSYLRRQPTSTICGHVFCKECITAAIRASHNCPLCRKKLNSKAIHPLHL